MAAASLTPEQVDFEEAWTGEFYQAADSLNWDRWSTFFSEDAEFTFANAPTVRGLAEIGPFVQATLGTFSLMSHNLTRFSFDVEKQLNYHSAQVTYALHSSIDPELQKITVPGVGIITKRFGERKLTKYEVYIDTSPVQARAKELLAAKAAAEPK
ncbi:hypothetical protein BCR35DRAFT_329710 [Leucosporidium creatinivorum]|uniref:SnoaL-like domain-containing protein n=1 Tax=Leucosporidium creatinivorum TaxID=106004 RepID=A0A1Y2FZ34_9BASI|nr:hypothetical protein BCR35DRAFT_329710 [Leucosporidium creatinivorum]